MNSRRLRRALPRLIPTDQPIFESRRRFIRTLSGGAIGLAWSTPVIAMECSQPAADESQMLEVPFARPEVFPATRSERFNPANVEMTLRKTAASHNNFYEFLPGRGGPVYKYVEDFEVAPWTIEVTGECGNPRVFDLDDLFEFEHEERVYHFRCVETWAMNVPWTGFPLSRLLDAVAPKSSAKFVRFVTANRPSQMPGMKEAHWYNWPYYEALRMDEARNELAMLVTGIYGEPLLKQHGAPVRVICPWKYGYKSPKSIVRIELVREQPATFWNDSSPREYGFYSNVNPNVPHPRWSQAQEYLLDDRDTKRPTKLFNGYAGFVSDLYPNEPREPLDKAPDDPI
ncbi:MAG: protein-methionine-sulfoxide reductase catalytic subunit MsrP [Phycisphaerales bacterium]